MRRYYFAYHVVNGLVFPLAWAEEDGLPVGGIPEFIAGSKVEITAEQFKGGLVPLENEFPIPLPRLPKLTPEERPEST